MEYECTFSIIITLFNKGPFIGECISSILKQTYRNFEVLIVDDGSEDNGPEICMEYKESDSRIRVIRQENKGVVKAREAGLIQAVGHYCILIDADDTWEDVMLENLKNAIDEYDPDMIMFNIETVNENGDYRYTIESMESSEAVELKSKKDVYSRLVSTSQNNNITSKAFKRQYVTDICKLPNKNLRYGEDLLQSFLLARSCSKFVHINKVLYKYREHSSSVIMSKKSDFIDDVLEVRNYVMNQLEIDGLKEEYLPAHRTHMYQMLFGYLLEVIMMESNLKSAVHIIKQVIKRSEFDVLDDRQIIVPMRLLNRLGLRLVRHRYFRLFYIYYRIIFSIYRCVS